MAAANIILPFSVDAFNKVNDYFHVRQYGDRDKKLYQMLDTVNAFGNLYCSSGMEATAGLSLSHRHFDLKKGEMKIAIQQSDTLLRIKATPMQDVPPGAKVLPYLFQPVRGEDGKVCLVPLEYVIHDDPEHIAALERDIEAICNPKFLEDFWNLAEDRNVQGLYGIFLQSRDFLHYSISEGTIEGSGEGDRTLEVKVVPKKQIRDAPDATTVGWSFRKDGESGKAIPVSACSAMGHGDPDPDETWNCSVCPHCHHPTCYPGCKGVAGN